MLGHIRSGTLDKFKEAFDKTLESGEGFSVAARDCAQSYMALFDEGCAGKSRLKDTILLVKTVLEKASK